MEIELPNGQIAEFPDDMPHEQIESVLKRHFSPKIASQNDQSEAFQNIKQRYPGMPEFMINALMPAAVTMAETPEDVTPGTPHGAMWRAAARAPLEAANNLASLIGLNNNENAKWPSLIAESESDKSHPFLQLLGSAAGAAPLAAGGINALRAVPAWGGLVERASPSLLRSAPLLATEGSLLGAGMSPEGQRGEGALLGAALGVGGAAIPAIGRGFGALTNRISYLRNLDKLKNEGKLSAEEYENAVAKESSLEDLMKQKGLGTNAGKLESELPEYRAQSEELGRKIGEIPEENIANLLPHPEGEHLVPESENLLKTAEKKAADIEEGIGSHLGEGLSHDVRAAEGLNKIIKSKKEEIGSIYNDIKSDLKETNVTLPRGREVNQITGDIQKAIKEGGYGSKEVEKLAQELDNAQKGGTDIVRGDDFLAMYRSTRSLANKAARNSRKTDIDALERQHWEKQYDELTNTADRMNELLKNHMNPESYADLQKANERWRTEITPLYKNRLYHQITKEGRLPSDIIHQLRGTGEGQEILREMIKDNPEILKNVLGQRYAHAPKKLQEFDEEAQQYINKSPELQNLINENRLSLREILKNQKNVLSSKQKASEFKKESEKVNKSFEETKKQQMERQKLTVEQQKLTEKLQNAERYLPELKKIARSKNISLQKKIEVEAKIAKAEKDIETLKNYLMWGTVSAGSALLGGLLGTRYLRSRSTP